jgi:ribosomal-protein-alanine N-acetyltransferase
VEQLVSKQLKHWEERKLGWWAVEPRFSRKLMGWCGLQYLPETEETEVGFLLGKSFWGQGFATEAAKASLRYGFEDLGLKRVVGITHPENIASQRVLLKLGMSFTVKTRYFGMDCYRYSIDRSDQNRIDDARQLQDAH